MLINFVQKFSLLAVLVLLVSCTQFNRFLPHEQDAAPTHKVDPASIQDAIPRHDEVTRAGNKNPYTVLGKTYHLLPTSKGYYQGGVASWYGTKFHGRPTANGEIYSLYAMTAAHKTLPIPSYVKVTNIENQRTAIVRVNDRGPFHDHRIIDLSYAAAVKLGYAEKGTAKVIVEAIDLDSLRQQSLRQASPQSPTSIQVQDQQVKEEHYFLQVASFKNITSANQLRARLLLELNQPVRVIASEPAGFYRVQLGPLATMALVEQMSTQLQGQQYTAPQLITESLLALD
ncbi:septal ring lytic transglycosylase RlpA family protein [Oceanicoccus sp. KOV_DT_Chl]|uniref:septal ring lytic transglycosylase RlpA family protein n=1 Tax=Oceanicoccus sp. KOV_DT_Chl TaxID=1904639 RepID=UPI000C7E7A2B|nr:septal ring lytic transglycosylase RlpA family protein [Oceanicoccus sp. KOV_DT_Chl]